MSGRLVLLAAFLFGGCQCGDPMEPSGDAGPDEGTTDVSSDAPSPGDTTSGDASETRDSDEDADGSMRTCGSDVTESATVAGWTVVLDHSDGQWEATENEAGVTLSGPAVCDGGEPVRAFEGEPEIRAAFGNYRIDLQADAVRWYRPTGALPRFEETDESVVLTYTLSNGTVALTFDADDGGNLRIRAEHDLDGAEFTVLSREGESFFGLGTQVTGMDLRGGTYPLWTQEQGNSKPADGGNFPLNNIPEAAYAPMGVWHSSVGWSGVVTHDGYSELDLGETAADRVSLRSHRAHPGFVVLTGTPRDRVTAVTEYTGRVRDDVPDWVFGLWVDSVTGPVRLQSVANALRDNDIPASAIWSEDWIGGSSTQFGFRLSYEWSWDPATYPDLPTTVDDLHSRGFAFLGYFNPFVPDTTSTWDEAVANGYLISDADGEPITFLDPAFRDAGLVDLFNTDAVEWLRGFQVSAVTDVGLDGWMADFAEWYPLEADAPNAWAGHNLYPLEWQRANDTHLAEGKEQLGEPGDYVFFPRSGWASVNGGTGGVVPAMWGGDQNTTWQYDDGFPTIIPIGAHVGLSGVPIFGSDIAGYNSIGQIENTDKELWFRWASAAAFHPLMRTHHGGDECNNWNFDRDQQTLEHTRRWSTIHSLLLPEFRRLYGEAVRFGWPISRHPWLVRPELPELWTGEAYQWFLGRDVLIAPVLEQGATSRSVIVPEADWWPLFGTGPIDSSNDDPETEGVEIIAGAAVSEIPVYVHGGRALTMLGEAPDSFYGAAAADVTDLTDVTSYRVALYPDFDGQVLSASDTPFAIGGRDLNTIQFGSAAWNGTLLQTCAGDFSQSCLEGSTFVLVDVLAGTLTAGEASIDIDSPEPITVRIGVGGAAWGELATPTGFTPNPDAASWCPDEME